MAVFTEEVSDDSPVTLEEAKSWAKANMDASPDDDFFAQLINAAFENLEEETNLEFVSRGQITELHSIRTLQSWELWTLQPNHYGAITVYNDSNRVFGAGTEVPSTELIIDQVRGKVQRVGSGSAFPSFFEAGIDVVQIVYFAGFQSPKSLLPAAAPPMPSKIKSLVLETAASYFYHATEKGFNKRGYSDEAGNKTFLNFDFIPPVIMRKLNKIRRVRGGRSTGRRIAP